jgi:hypothetical protein
LPMLCRMRTHAPGRRGRQVNVVCLGTDRRCARSALRGNHEFQCVPSQFHERLKVLIPFADIDEPAGDIIFEK